MDHPVLHVRDLHVQFVTDTGTVNAVNGVNLQVKRGSTVGIVGESGSGKSTTMMAVMRLLSTGARIGGQVDFLGENLLSLSKKQMRKIRGHRISMIFQNPSTYLNPTKTIGKQMIEPLLYHHLASPAEARRRAVQLLGDIGISNPEKRFDNYPFEFSGGMLQRVMIGMALLSRPHLLIADEPTTALDVTVQAEILWLLKKLQQETGMAMVLVTHDLAVAAQVCDEIYVMYGGEMVEHLPSEMLLKSQAHPYLQGLIQSIPKLSGEKGRLPYIPGQPLGASANRPTGCIFADRCAYRFERCAERPPLLQLGERHEVACWKAGAEVSV
jgi:oligopeptide/dipeptide ABC transporter ATP-binding protein